MVVQGSERKMRRANQSREECQVERNDLGDWIEASGSCPCRKRDGWGGRRKVGAWRLRRRMLVAERVQQAAIPCLEEKEVCLSW